MNNRSHRAAVFERKEIAKDTFAMTFELEKPLIYQSGQYLWIELDTLIEADPKGNRRAFSITNPSLANGTKLEIIFRKSKSGFKKTLTQIPNGTHVTIHAPFGSSFLLPKNEDLPIVLVSAGTGIAPFLCVIRDIIQRAQTRSIQLFHYESDDNCTFFKEEISKFNDYRIQNHLFFTPLSFEDFQSIPNKKDTLFYLSGPQAFIDHAHHIFLENGILPTQIICESNYPTQHNQKSLDLLLQTHIASNGSKQKLNSFLQNQIFRMALDTSSSHIIITDTNGVIRYANKSAELITGFRVSEMIGNTPRLWGGLMEPSFYQKMWDMKIRKIPMIEEITNRRKNGELYVAIVHISPISDIDGDLLGFMATEEDITTLRNREEELATLSNHFILATSSANIATWEWNILTDKLLSDNVLFRLYGVDLKANPSGAFVAFSERLHPDDKERITHAMQEIIQNPNKPFDLKYKIITPTGEIKTLRAVADVERDETGKAIKAVGVNWDITREEEVDHAKTEFISLASHELRTPITTIRWYTEMLLHGNLGTLNDKQRDYLNEIYQGNKHLVELVNTLLDVSRLELGKFTTTTEMTDFHQEINIILEELKPQILNKQLQLVTNIDPAVPKIVADPKLLDIIFQNLFTNAIKYTKEKGIITLTMHLDEEKQNVLVSISDTGFGIPLAEQKSIFSKLFRASNIRNMVQEGTGLGLYLTKSITERTGGKIWFESKENIGSTFYVSFPITGMKIT